MIQFNPDYVKEYLKLELLEVIESIGGEYKIVLNDVDELHDYTIESCSIERVYYELYSILPIIFDELAEFVEDEQDYYDPWREHCDADFYGV